jgi:hypothetical protein
VTNVWLVRCGEGGSAVDACITNDVVAVRFTSVGDVSERDSDLVLEEIRTMTDRTDHDRLAADLMAFATDLAVGDLVLTPHKERRRYFLGVVTGDYEWIESPSVPNSQHTRATDWVSFLDWDSVPLEFRSIKYYQRTVLRTDDRTIDAECQEALQRRHSKSELLGAASPKRTTSPRTRKSTAKAPKPAPAPHDKVCSGCHLRKPFSQFSPASSVCVDCE